VQSPLRVERSAEGEQVMLVGTAAMVKHQQTRRIAGGGPLTERERAHSLIESRPC
jgi:hypothetical protein